jgi:hypothetical protein
MTQVSLTDALLSERSVEVAAYLEFLKVAVERRARIIAKDGALVLELSHELTHTLKANLVLLLYSAMEATLIQLLDEMHDAIKANCTSVDVLNAQLLRVVLKTVKKDSNEKVLSSVAPLHNSLFEFWIKDWEERSSGKDKRVDDISGSVDSLVFYQQLAKFGVVPPTENGRAPADLSDYTLQKVKNKRNELAHGEKSFTDLGRDLSAEDLESDSSKVFENLRKIADAVDKYLQDQRYLASQPGSAVIPSEAGSEA